MKKVLNVKKMIFIFAVMIFAMLVPATVQAKTVSGGEKAYTLYPSSSKSYNALLQKNISTNMNYLTTIPVKQKVTSFKSSNSAVASIGNAGKGQLAFGDSPYNVICIKAKKPGTATVSYKIGSTTYAYKVTVRKYVQPFSAIKLSNKNIAAKFKSNNTLVLSYAKYANKKFKLDFIPKSGWTVFADYLPSADAMKSTIIKNGSTFKVGAKGVSVNLYATNVKTGQNVMFRIVFN